MDREKVQAAPTPANLHEFQAPAPAENPALKLQRAAGNHAMSALLREMAPSAAPEMEVARDPKAEAEADSVADAAVTHLGDKATHSPVAGGALSPELRDAMGAVAPTMRSLDAVQVHTDVTAHADTDAIDARAFTSGHDVSVGRGELVDAREGHRLLAHEAAHAALHQPQAAENLVHAKLRGTHQALVAKGGGPTSGKLRKLVHAKTNWDKICDALGAYEELEAAALKGGNPSQKDMLKITPKLLTQLAKVESACNAWLDANKTDSDDKRSQARKKMSEQNEVAESDTRDKAERRQAIALLVPRIGLEKADLQNGKWTEGMGASDAKKTGTGQEKEGGVNKTKELMYVTESGKFSGYFKEDKGFAHRDNYQGHEADVGIHQMDPNYGARTVAMYRLDKLFGANVTAKAEFATHDGKLGTVLETAKGDAATDVKWAKDEAQQKQMGPGAVLTSDPVLQRGMSKLQIFDAICGQLDRHQGNWVVDVDPKTGKVRGITGIDLDMAFGSEQTDTKKAQGENYLGLPPLMDAEFANRLLLVLPNDIRNALKGLLSESEIEATVVRFESVRTAIREAKEQNKLVETWDDKTALENQPGRKVMKSGHKSYGSQVSGMAVTNALTIVKKAVAKALKGHDDTGFFNRNLLYKLDDLPDATRDGMIMILDHYFGYSVPVRVLWTNEVAAGKVVQWGLEGLNDVLSDDAFLDRMIVKAQESDNAYIAMRIPFEERVEQYMKEWLSSHSKQKQPV